MSNLIETVTVKIILHRDRFENFPYDNAWEVLKRVWPHVCPWSNRYGHLRLNDIEIEWSNTGLEEVPEVSGTDN